MTRKYGHGSLYQRQSDGRWIGRLPDGRGGHRYLTGTDRDDVARRLETARKDRDRMTSGSPRGGERLRDLASRYLSTIAPKRNRPRTLEDHAQVVRDHIVPVIGSVRVTQLRAEDVQRMADRMLSAGLSPKTTQNAVGVLSAVLRQAQREGTVEVNVAGLAVLPRIPRRQLPSLSTAEVRAFLAATKGELLWPVWVMAATTGLRIGEVLGLLWRDVTGSTIAVTGQYRYRGVIDGQKAWDREALKTEASAATLYLPALAREALDVAKAQATSAKLVFANSKGHPLNRSWVTHAFADALAAHGFPAVRLHSLRHSSIVAVLDETGGDLRAAQALARHQNVATTINVYGREADEARRKAATATDRAMSKEAR